MMMEVGPSQLLQDKKKMSSWEKLLQWLQSKLALFGGCLVQKDSRGKSLKMA